MREFKVNVTNAPSRYVLIAAESALEAERLATRDGYAVFGYTVPWPGSDDRNEFEGMTPRELRNLCRSLQEDLRRAIEDRATLRNCLQRIHRTAEGGVLATFDGEVVNELFRQIIAEIMTGKINTEGSR